MPKTQLSPHSGLEAKRRVPQSAGANLNVPYRKPNNLAFRVGRAYTCENGSALYYLLRAVLNSHTYSHAPISSHIGLPRHETNTWFSGPNEKFHIKYLYKDNKMYDTKARNLLATNYPST